MVLIKFGNSFAFRPVCNKINVIENEMSLLRIEIPCAKNEVGDDNPHYNGVS